MKKTIGILIFVVLCASLFMLVACGENSDKTYSLNTTEDGVSVSYSLQFLKGNSVKLVRTADGKTVTYEGTYSDLGKGKYSINIEDSSTLDPIDNFYFNLSITVDGEKFTFDKEKTSSQKSIKETEDDKKENENYVIENPEKVIDYSGNYDENTKGTGDNHGESTGGVQPGEVKKPQGNNDQCIHKNLYFEIDKIYNEDKELVEKANHPMEILYIPVPEKVFLNDMGRKVK